MNLRLNANALVMNKDGKILLIKLKKGPFAGGLCIPGGGINPGELGYEAISREIREETGIDLMGDILPYGFCEIMKESINKHRVVLLFYSQAEGVPKETDEGIAFWENYENAKEDLIPFAKEAIRIWNEKKIHFTLKE